MAANNNRIFSSSFMFVFSYYYCRIALDVLLDNWENRRTHRSKISPPITVTTPWPRFLHPFVSVVCWLKSHFIEKPALVTLAHNLTATLQCSLLYSTCYIATEMTYAERSLWTNRVPAASACSQHRRITSHRQFVVQWFGASAATTITTIGSHTDRNLIAKSKWRFM